jgi:hypothetical protein
VKGRRPLQSNQAAGNIASLDSAFRTRGATRVPSSSIARMSLACGKAATLIWNVRQEMPRKDKDQAPISHRVRDTFGRDDARSRTRGRELLVSSTRTSPTKVKGEEGSTTESNRAAWLWRRLQYG